MVKHTGSRPPQRGGPRPATDAVEDEPTVTPEELQAIAHARGRICKDRRCDVCAPLREARRLKRAQRTRDVQAQAHAMGQPCRRTSCTLEVCVSARQAAAVSAATPAASGSDETATDDASVLRWQGERHRAGVPCRSEQCRLKLCVEGFAIERTRRHRARRPCRSADCDNPICVSSRSGR